MSKFTKGKWKTAAPHEYIVYEDFTKDKLIIASEIEGYTEEEANANARLIAAAPEMYELLKEELIPTSDYGGIISFEREKKIKTLLARIDDSCSEFPNSSKESER